MAAKFMKTARCDLVLERIRVVRAAGPDQRASERSNKRLGVNN